MWSSLVTLHRGFILFTVKADGQVTTGWPGEQGGMITDKTGKGLQRALVNASPGHSQPLKDAPRQLPGMLDEFSLCKSMFYLKATS